MRAGLLRKASRKRGNRVQGDNSWNKRLIICATDAPKLSAIVGQATAKKKDLPFFGELGRRSWGRLGGAWCRLFPTGNGDLHCRKRPALRPHFVVSSSTVSVTRHEWPERCSQRPSFTFSAPPNPPPMTARELQIRLQAAQPPTLLHVLPPEVFAATRIPGGGCSPTSRCAWRPVRLPDFPIPLPPAAGAC